MKKLAIIMAVLTSLSGYARSYTTVIKISEGEYWYGGYTAKAYCNTPFDQLLFHPYPEECGPNDLGKDNKGNQAAPLLISNKGRYVWSDEPFSFEFKSGKLIVSSEFEEVTVKESGGCLRDAYVTAMKIHFPPSGKTPDPLMFRMPQYNTWIELGPDQNQKDILKYASDIVSYGFPTGVFMVDDGWAYDYGNFDFDHRNFPDPKAMVDELHGMGFKIMLWLTPFISPDSREFKDLKSMEALVMDEDGKNPAIIRWWNGNSACLDLTKNVAVEWLKDKLTRLQEKYGIDGFKFDAADFDFYSGSGGVFDNVSLTNTKGYLQAEEYSSLGSEFPFNELRASWKNGNQPIAQRLQDKGYSWQELTLLIPDMVSAGLIGHHFTCPDMIGGGLLSTFENVTPEDFDQELMIRSAQNQAMMPMMQFSVAPWRVLDDEHLAICRSAALLHSEMGDEIYAMARKAAEEGEPIVRHMEYAFPHQGFSHCIDQYMFGDRYLVAPMLTKGDTRKVSLPEGRWKDDEGKIYKGGRTVEIKVPLDRLPYFEKIR